MSGPVEANPWDALRRYTRARIALGRVGSGLPTAPLLAFELAHAQARDAVHHPLDVDELHSALHARGLASLDAHSAAPDRDHYLRRPDLGRRLDAASLAVLRGSATQPVDLVFVIADGLSSRAAAAHALPLLDVLLPKLEGWRVGPVVVARQSRVALGDEIGETLRAAFVAMLIGERPGLSSPDSMGLYLTATPHVGCTDAERNCISNVRPEGLGYAAAAAKLHYLLTRAHTLGYTGVNLKDDSDDALDDARGGAPALGSAPDD
jgi:ethanolamine ammonia-lyase small subunit